MARSVDRRIATIRELVRDDFYVVDTGAVAEAIVTRCVARQLIVGTGFRSSERVAPPVRSFRPSGQARSFRPCASASTHQRR